MMDLHERIVTAAYPLFITRGIRDVTVDEIQVAAHVSATEFSEEFATRDDLAAECLDRRERAWTLGIVAAGARARSNNPEGQLLAIFDVFDDWFHRNDYEACTFINVLLEMGKDHPLGRASLEYLVHIRHFVFELATEAGLRDAEEFTFSWHILMKGSIINAVEGDQKAATRARVMATDLIARHRPVPSTGPAETLDPTNVHDSDWYYLHGFEAADFSATAAHQPTKPAVQAVAGDTATRTPSESDTNFYMDYGFDIDLRAAE